MNILIVDDNQATLHLHELNLKKWGHTIFLAENGAQALKKLDSQPIDLVLSDWIMPEMDGIELCRTVRDTDYKRYIYFIITSAEKDQQKIIEALKAKADDYIAKPVDYEELQVRIEIGARIIGLERKLKSNYATIEKNFFQTIRTFTNLLEVFDEELGGHCRRVGRESLRLAKMHPEISKKDYRFIEAAGLLHDIGMIGLASGILSKKRTELNLEEKQQYLSHPVRGEIVLNEIEFLQPIAKIIRSHHEQFNGRGFPDGLSGSNLPIAAQIVSAASIYDNLIHKAKMPLEDIPTKLYAMRKYQLEPSVVDILLEVNTENIRKENEKKFFEISIDSLQKGMIIAQDIRMKTGAIIIPAETVLTDYSIEKLKSYRLLQQFDHNIYIFK